MATKIKLDIVTPEKAIYSQDVNMLIARTTAGDIGILPGHAPLIAALITWPLRVMTDEGERQLAICGGFIEVQPEKITILASCAETAEQIDVERAKKAKERAENRLHGNRTMEGMDVARAEAALKRAIMRLKVAGFGKRI